ncbi:SUKH-4 family immunity protein [Streptomyces sp. NPDC051569]|uniref:SUKH-4 family immunity protein n=1 Tax=Streptomyces sp. NPDC051569 TaxID=3365661 RepID=UPI0037AEFBD6
MSDSLARARTTSAVPTPRTTQPVRPAPYDLPRSLVVISQAQALATADQWLNPPDPQAPRREVAMYEFELGWVVWAAPTPPERDPLTGERRPPADFGNACGVVDRRSGELTLWPSVPVEEVVRMYQRKHGGATADTSARPVTGPGNTAVFTYLDPANGEETSLSRSAGPGLPPVEHQAWAELRRMNVPTDHVVAIHTDLRPSLLPGGYTARVLHAFPRARFSCTQNYGLLPEERAEGVAGLVQQAELMSRIAGRQPPPRPYRLPVPTDVAPAEPLPDVALGHHLTEVFGADGVRRYDPDDIAGTVLPDTAKATLTRTGLPADLPFFFTADRSDAPPAGGLFTDAATHLRELGSEVGARSLEILENYVRIGSDGTAVITVQCPAPEDPPETLGPVWAISAQDATGRRVNESLAAYLGSLALLATTRRRMRGLDPVAAGLAVAAFQERLVALDATALDDAGNWWSLVVEQMWHGLF